MSLEEEVDGLTVRYIALVKANEDVMAPFEIPVEIDESQLVEIMKGRVPSADEYFKNEEN